MSHPDSQSTDADFRYVGQELDLFAQARNWKSYYARHLRPFIRGRVLEVGAGIGSTTRVLATGKEESWTCLEPDAQLATQLRARVADDEFLTALAPQVHVGTISELPGDARFDTILYIDVVEHIEDDANQLKQAAARLGEGGHVIVLSPAHQWLFSPFDEAIGHFRRYNRDTLRAVGPTDCQLVLLRYLDSVGLLASLANRVALRSSSPTERQIAFWDRFMVPVSRVVDPCFAYRLGKSIVAVWRR